MFTLVYSITLIFENLYAQLILSVVAGVFFYAIVVFGFRFKELSYLKLVIKR